MAAPLVKNRPNTIGKPPWERGTLFLGAARVTAVDRMTGTRLPYPGILIILA
jgi:hypothetical protein